MKRTGLKRATSGVLSVAMIASALFSDFSVPTSVYASDDTSSVETALEGYSDSDGSITSEYIVENLDEDLGEEAAALNEDAAYMVAEEYLVSELTEVTEDTDTVSEDAATTDTETVTETDTETDDVLTESIGASTNDADAVSTSSNDVEIASLSLDNETETVSTETEETVATEETIVTEVTVSEEEVAEVAEAIIDTSNDITTADDYDTNGLAATYHYITLNYSLVNEDLIWDGITIDDVWNEVPEAFIASYLTSVNVYTLEDNEDYYVAFIDPAALNGLGSAIYADFTDIDTLNPTVYNDIITFDTETGLVYIPKSFYFNENGEEVLKGLEAQVLVPYSFDNDTSTVSVSVLSDIDGVEGISGSYSVPTLDVTTTIQIVSAEDADKISLDDISVTVNDDMLPIDLSGENAYYDTETGELTLSASPNNVYSISVTIAENEAEETLAMIEQREILVASTDEDLSGILVADTKLADTISYTTSVSDMNIVPNVTVTVDGTLKAGQTFDYSCTWASVDTHNSASLIATVNQVIDSTCTFSYYGLDISENSTLYQPSAINETNYSSIFDANGNVILSGNPNAAGDLDYLAVAYSSASKEGTYNRMASLPDSGTTLECNETSTVSTKWTVGNVSGVAGYEKYVAMQCVHNAQGVATSNNQVETTIVTLLVLYASDDYMVFAINLPEAGGQSGSSVFKVKTEPTNEKAYIRFGINKVSSTTGKKLAATFGYSIAASMDGALANAENIAETAAAFADGVKNGTYTKTDVNRVVSADLAYGGHKVGYLTSGTGSTVSTITYYNSDATVTDGPNTYDIAEGTRYIAIAEVVAPTDYEPTYGVWIITVEPGELDGSAPYISAAVFYSYDTTNGLSTTATNVMSDVSSSKLYFTVEDEPSTTEYTVTKKFSNTLTSNLVKSVTVELYADGVDTGKSATLQSSNSWSYTWTGLDKSSNGTDIEYTVEETGVVMYDQYNSATTYTVSSSSVDKVFAVSTTTADGSSTITNKITTTELDVEKTFGNNDTENRISEVVVTLYRNNVSTGKTITLSDSNNWSGTFSNLVKYDSTGTAYSYKAVETGVTYTDMWDKEHKVTSRSIITKLFTVSETTSSGKTTVKNTFNTTSHTVKKVMGSDTTKEVVNSVTIRLYADNTSLSSVFGDITLSDSNSWSDKWTGLDLYDYQGNKISYTAAEVSVDVEDPYTATVSTVSSSNLKTVFTVNTTTANGTTTTTNTVQTRPLYVEKTFGNNDTEDRISEVVVTLYRNNVSTGVTLTLNEANNWSGTFENLLTYDTSGNEYSYKAVETSVTYTDMWDKEHKVTSRSIITKLFTVTEITSGETTTITNTFNTVDHDVSKAFADSLTKSLVTSVTAMLTADGKDAESAFANLVLTEDNSWTSTWYGIDMYDHEGNVIEYGAKEVSLTMKDQYDATVISKVENALKTVFDVVITPKEGETVIDNTVVTTEHTVVKKFGENTDGRITEVEVTLYRNGKAMPATLTLNEANGWTNTFTDLVKYDPDGNEYKYSAVETKVTYNDMWGTSHTITDEKIINTVFDVDAVTADNTTTITNTIVVTKHSVVKTFGSDLTESLVESIVAELFANKVSLETVFGNKTLTKATDWSATWEKLDKYDYTGSLYNYTSEEVSVDMEDQFDADVVSTVKDALHTVFTVITSTKNGTTTVDNTVNITHLDVEKVFGDKTEQRIKEVVVTLYRNGEAKPYTLTLNADNNWSDTFEKLVKYDPDGNEYVYTAVETSVTYYDMWGDEYTVTDPDVMDKLFNVEEETSNNKTTITNTFEYTTRAIIKNFATLITANRMVQVTTTLYADNVSTKSLFGDKTLSADNAWADIWDGYDALGETWIGLDKYDHNGNLITYTVRETTASYLDKNFHSGTVHTVIGDVLVTLFEPVYNDEVDETTSEVTNHLQTTDITVEKKFGEGTEGRVTSVIVELYENGKATGCTVALDDTNGWTYTWEQLDKFDSTGVTYDYTVKEISVTYTDMWGDSYTITDEKLMNTIFDIDVDTTPTKTVITNTLRQTEYTVSKTFGSELTEDLVKNIVAELFADGNSLEGVFGNKTLDADNSWTDTWTGLDKFDHEGNRIHYTAAEVSADVEDQFNATVVSTVKSALETVFDVITTTKRGETSVDNTIVTTELDVEKTFGDNTENRISEVEVTLYRNGEAVDYVRTLNADNSWSYTFTDLVMYDPDGVAYEYEAVETGVTYTDMWGNEYTVTDADVLDKLFNVEAVTEGGKTTITNTFEYTERAVTKAFATDLAEKRIQAITTTLYADSASLETVFGDITLNADNSWTSLWTGLDKYDYEGNKIVYTVRETTATYLDMDNTLYTVSDNALVIIFTPTVDDEVDETSSEITNDFAATEHTVIKTFGDVVSEDRVINVVAELYRNGEETGRTVVLSEENDWTYTWTELDMYDSTGEAYEYTAVEVSVTYMDVRGDEQTISGEMLEKIFNSEEETLDKVTLLTNTLETVEHEVVKVFMEDTTAKDDVEYITVQLYADGIATGYTNVFAIGDEVTLNDENGWTYTWTDLDMYNADGSDVVYTVKEILINGETTPTPDNGYIVTYNNDITTITTITNDTTKELIKKTDIVTTEEVPGATLTIYTVDEEGNRTVYDSWTSTTEPHYIEKIPTGNYVLVEEYAPGSYVTAQEVEFTVEATGEIQIVEMIDDFTKVEISKTDIVNGEEVEGAILSIYSVDENGERTLVETWESTTEPHYIERLDKGNYVLVEEYAPGSYVTAHEVEFTVEDTAEIQKVNMEDDFTKVEISKTDMVDCEEVPGATLTVYEQNEDGTKGKLVETWVTDGEPHTIERLDKGTYILVEENTPDGYQVAEEVVFEVTDTAEIQKVEMKDARTYGKVVVNKTDDSGNPIEGVEFTITNKETGEIVAVLTTDENGYAESEELPIDERAEDQSLVSIVYVIQETAAPDYYVIDDTETEFTFEYVDDTTPVVEYEFDAVNKLMYGILEIHKVDQDGNPLGAGVEFLVTCVDTGETWTLVTDENGYASIDKLLVGAYVDGEWVYYTYTLQETKTLDNYKLDDTVYTWQFSADNRQAEALYQSYTVKNVILGVEDMSAAGGVGMLMLAIVFVLMAVRKKKDEDETEIA